MIRVLLFFILTVILYWALKELFSKGGGKDGPGTAGEEMVKDPNCGVYLPRSSAVTFGKGSRRQYFCSEECRKAYVGRTEDKGRRE